MPVSCPHEDLSLERRRSNKFHVVSAKERGILDGRVRDGGSAEELLHLSSRGESNQQAARLFAHHSKGVRNVTRPKNGVSGAKMLPGIPDLKKDLALQHIEPLLLMGVYVKRRTTLHQVE